MPKTIFVLEDDESFSIVFRRWLEETGYRAISVVSIEEAKRILPETETPSLFWIDYYLGQGETGMDFFQWLREDSRWRDIPAIIVSITVNASKLNEFEAKGIAKAFSKTLADKEAILEGIKKILGK